MTLYSSKTPRDLNRDPLPFTSHHGRHEDADPAGWDFDVEFTYAPRSEFDRPQHNTPNPILLDYRLDIEHTGWRNRDPWDWFFEVTTQWPGLSIPWNLDQINHARRVFTKLSNLAKVES